MKYLESTRNIFLFPGRVLVRSCFLLLIVGVPLPVTSDEALVAVATNFYRVANHLKSEFELDGTHQITLATGSTGKLYAQVLHGAPYDAMLAADQERPRLLEMSGHAVMGTRFVYAVGRLTLWGPKKSDLEETGRSILERGEFDRLAIANPELAPYGAASKETLTSLGVWNFLREKIVMGENIGQAQVLVETLNADLGLVALSHAPDQNDGSRGSSWNIPASLHKPILQDAVLLEHGSGNAAAMAFLEYLQDEGTRETIESFGYGMDHD